MNAVLRLNWGRRLFLGFMTLICLVPLLWTGLASLGMQVNTRVTPVVWRLSPTLDSYYEVREEQTFFWQEIAMSALLSAAATLLTVSAAFLAAFALARSRFRGRGLLVQGLLILGSLPVIAYVIPLREMMRYLHLQDTFTGIVLAEAGLFAPLVTYILYGYVARIPPELEEAARLDGATLLQMLWHVVLPTALVGVLATAVMTYALSWNQFLLPLVLSDRSVHVIPVMMRDFFSLEREFVWSKAAAVIVIALLPIGLFAAAVQRLLERFSLGVESVADLGVESVDDF